MTTVQQKKDDSWMTPSEQAVYKSEIKKLSQWARQHHLSCSPSLKTRIREIAVLIIVGQRLEQDLLTFPDKTAANGPPFGTSGAEGVSHARDTPKDIRPMDSKAKSSQSITISHAEGLAKHWERLRKAMLDLETYYAKNGAPAGKGLADIIKPIMQKGQGVMEEALASPPPETKPS